MILLVSFSGSSAKDLEVHTFTNDVHKDSIWEDISRASSAMTSATVSSLTLFWMMGGIGMRFLRTCWTPLKWKQNQLPVFGFGASMAHPNHYRGRHLVCRQAHVLAIHLQFKRNPICTTTFPSASWVSNSMFSISIGKAVSRMAHETVYRGF